MATPNSAAEVLAKAKYFLRNGHWIKGSMRRAPYKSYTTIPMDEFRYCSLGAIEAANTKYQDEAILTIAKEILTSSPKQRKYWGNVGVNDIDSIGLARDIIVRWNDDRNRRHDDIERMFDRAIERTA